MRALLALSQTPQPAGVQHRTGIKPHIMRDVEDGDLWPSGLLLYRLAMAFAVPLPTLVITRRHHCGSCGFTATAPSAPTHTLATKRPDR